MNRRMDSRRDRTVPIVAGIVALATIAAAVYWFVIRDDDKTTSSNQADQTFQVAKVPFTFKYPGNFAQAPTPEGFLWISGIGPYDILDVKRLANKERSLKATQAEIRAALKVRPGLTISGEGTDTAGLTQVVRFTVDSTVAGQQLRSNLYYFSMGGASWQLECQSTAKGRAQIDAACSQMLSTFSAE